MECTFEGFKFVEYISKRTNKPVKGYEVYLSYTSPNVTGRCCEKMWVSVDVFSVSFSDFVPGAKIQCYFDRFGNISEAIKA